MHGVHAHARARAVLWHVRVMACCELFEARLPTEGKRVANNNDHDFNFAVCVPPNHTTTLVENHTDIAQYDIADRSTVHHTVTSQKVGKGVDFS